MWSKLAKKGQRWAKLLRLVAGQGLRFKENEYCYLVSTCSEQEKPNEQRDRQLVTHPSVQYGSVAVNLPLIVIEGSGPLLFGRNWLAHFKLDWASIFLVSGVSPASLRLPQSAGQPLMGDVRLNSLLTEFPDVFKDELGCYKGEKVTIEVDPEVTPRFFKARPVPLAYRARVDAELDKQIRMGLWEEVKDSKWAAPMVIVPKGPSALRLCGDYRLTVNRVARLHQYPLPRVEELLVKLTGCKTFSKVDLKSAYNQLVIDEKSREYLTLNTPRGLVRPVRLSFGYASAPALFQRTLDQLLCGLQGVAVFLDDVIIAAASHDQHDARLREVLKRLSDAGLRVNRSKCSFGVDSVTYLGYTVSSEGVHCTDDKLAAIRRAPEPQNMAELRAWLGLINYYSKFLRNLSLSGVAPSWLPRGKVAPRPTPAPRDCDRVNGQLSERTTVNRVNCDLISDTWPDRHGPSDNHILSRLKVMDI